MKRTLLAATKVSSNEAKAIKSLAKRAGLTPSAYMRRKILENLPLNLSLADESLKKDLYEHIKQAQKSLKTLEEALKT